MADSDSGLSGLKKAGAGIAGAPDSIKQAADSTAGRALSPFAQKKQEADAAIAKANAPFEAMRARQQQAKLAMDSAKQQAESAKKILTVKEMLFMTAKDASDKTMNDAQSTLNKAKQGIDERQKDYNNAGAFVKELMAKVEAQARGAAGSAGMPPGGKP
jgi:chromosome segregation ATPase